MKTIQKKVLIIGITFWFVLIAVLMYFCYTNDKFRNTLENYHFPENQIPGDAVGVWVPKN